MSGEIRFFRKCLEKMGLQCLSEKEDGNNTVFDYGIRRKSGERITLEAFIALYSDRKDKPKMVHVFDRYVLSFMILQLPEDNLVIGPYVVSMPTENIISSIARNIGVSKKNWESLYNLYYQVPEIKDEQSLIQSSGAVMELFWNDEWTHEDVNASIPNIEAYQKKRGRNPDTIETNYRQENLLIEAVMRGDAPYIRSLSEKIKHFNIALRVPDPVRNNKNYLIIMNTLLRKAAERGGVSVQEIDRLSSRFAHAIEECRTIERLVQVGASMPYAYVMLVRSNRFSSYSTIVTRAIVFMEENRTATLEDVASRLSVTPGWLSRCISRDTGSSFSEIMMKLRANYAGIRLLTSSDSMERIAEDSGFNDVSYFSRVFKRMKGKTPSEWRRSASR